MAVENFLMTDNMRKNKVILDELNLGKVFRSLTRTLANILDGKLCNNSWGPKVAEYYCNLPILDACGGSGCNSDSVYGFDETKGQKEKKLKPYGSFSQLRTFKCLNFEFEFFVNYLIGEFFYIFFFSLFLILKRVSKVFEFY